jgi:hypothetical protein
MGNGEKSGGLGLSIVQNTPSATVGEQSPQSFSILGIASTFPAIYARLLTPVFLVTNLLQKQIHPA